MIKICCDTCDSKLSINGNSIYTVGQSTYIDLNINGVEYHFCNYKCLQIFVNEELKKEKS